MARTGPSPTTTRSRGRPGGEDSRERLIDAAGRLFASHGFDGVSTRTIARAADVNLAAIAYHFESKLGLYHAVLARVVEDTERFAGAVIRRLPSEAPAAVGDPAALAALARWTVSELLTNLLAENGRPWASALILHEFQNPTPDFRPVMERRVLPLHDAIGSLVAAAYPAADRETVLLRTHAVVAQMMGFGAARQIVLLRTGWNAYTPHRVRAVIEAVTPCVLGALSLPTDETQ